MIAAAIVLPSLLSLVLFPEETSAYTLHSPIQIASDSDFTTANGVTRGDGTSSNPYIIEGWDIMSTATGGITIWYADAHFVVRNVYIHSGSLDSRGIVIYFANSGRVENAVISGGAYGIYTSSSNVTFVGNRISNTRCGIVSDSSANVTIVNNSISSIDYGVILGHSRTATVKDNYFANGGSGITLEDFDNATIAANTISDVTYGIHLTSSRNNSIVGNSVSPRVSNGISLEYAENTVIVGNDVSNGEYGIFTGYSNRSHVSGNSLSSNSVAGFYSYYSSEDFVENNTVRENQWGVVLNQSTAIVVHHNDFINNSMQAYDNRTSSNSWDNGYPGGGNFWSDFTGFDYLSGPRQDQAGSDGIGDTPYHLPWYGQDNYPLMAHYASKNPPVALFTIYPRDGQVATAFTADASSSIDIETPSGDLEVRWDWENDGTWDTTWLTNKTAQHQYSKPGDYSVRLQVRDADGFLNTTTRRITVWTNTATEATLTWLLIALIVVGVVLLLMFLIFRRRKSPPVQVSGTPHNGAKVSRNLRQ